MQYIAKENLKDNFVEHFYKNWGAEKYIEAGHSYDSVRMKKKARKIVSENLNEKVFFAGEATNFEGRHGGINGSVDSGVRAAREISEIHSSREALRPKL
jgi:lysine-specific histone demethylase 1B